VWALSKLLSKEQFARLRETHAGAETDPAVADEWSANN